MYIKIDDDIVYIVDSTIPAIVRTEARASQCPSRECKRNESGGALVGYINT